MLKLRSGGHQALLGLVLSCFGGAIHAADYYASPTASSSGTGTITAPWDLHTALKSPVVKPGDTIWMRGGTYVMHYPVEFWSTLSGTPTAPIIIRRYQNEQPVIDLGNQASSLFVYGSNTWFWGLEIMSTGIPRSTTNPGPWSILQSSIEVHGPGTKFINCYVHDLSQGLSYWHDSVGAEAYGNIVYHVGWQGPDRGHGHAIYSQNEAVSGIGRKALSENFLGEAFDIGLQLYGSGAAVVQDYYLSGNVVWNNGIPTGNNVDQIVIAGGGSSKRNIELDSNFMYNSGNSGYSRVGWGWDGENKDVNIHGNWAVGGYSAFELWHWDSASFHNNFICAMPGYQQLFVGMYAPMNLPPSTYSWDQNTYCGGSMKFSQTTLDGSGSTVILSGSNGTAAGFKAATGWDTNSTFQGWPTTGANTFVRPNKYEPGRANIIILNWQKQASVTVDLSGAGLQNGDNWVIRDVQNYNGAPVASGVYSSSNPIAFVPMSNLPKTQIQGWGSPIAHTGPSFGTFVLLGGAALGGTSNPLTASLTAPSAGQSVSGTVVVSALVADSNGKTPSVQFKLDGANLGSPVTAAPYQMNWNSSTASNGPHTLTAAASDSAGNAATSIPVTVTVNNTVAPPANPLTIALTSPAASQSVSGSVTVTAAVADAAGQTPKVQFKLDGANLGSPVTAAPYQISWNTASSSNGAHVLTASASDAAGNATDAAALSVTVANAAPPTSGKGNSAAFVKQDSATQGNWRSVYGQDGALINSDLTTMPTYARPSVGGWNWVWNANPTDLRSLQSSSGGRIASCWYSTTSFVADINITDGQTHQVAFYLMDYDNRGRTETVDVLDAATGAVLDTRSAANYSNGLYLVWNLSGHVQVRFTNTSSTSVILNGIFFGGTTGASNPTAPTVSLQTPTNGQTVSGSVSLAASASDAAGVAGVQFKLDSANLGSEITSAPYSMNWNSATVPNGSHTLSAVARNLSGLTTTTSVTLTVSNAVVGGSYPSPLAYWSLDAADTSAGQALDRSGNGINLPVTNTASVAGRLQQAMSFNGVNSSLALPSTKLDLRSSLTLSVWVKTTNSARSESIVSKYETSGNESGYLLRTKPDGTLSMRIGGRNTTSGVREIPDSTKINDGQWHHVAVVITLGQSVTFFVDGVQTSSTTCETVVGASSVPFALGNIDYAYYAAPLTGSLDEVKIFNSALTPAQIVSLASGN